MLSLLWQLLIIYLVFSKCSGSVEQGRRLENLSWRLWNREIFCCDPEEPACPSQSSFEALAIASNSSQATLNSSDLPELSGSIDSLASHEEAIQTDEDDENDDDDDHTTATATPLGPVRPHIVRHDSGSSTVSRGCERHINPCDLEKMISNIKQTSPATIKLQGTLDIPSKQSSPTLEALDDHISPTNTTAATLPNPSSGDIDAPAANSAAVQLSHGSTILGSLKSVTSVVRGFTPVIAPPNTSNPITSNPSSSTSTATTIPVSKKKAATFALGGSSQSDASFTASPRFKSPPLNNIPAIKKKADGRKPMFALGGSASGEDDSSFPSQPSASPQRSALSNGQRRPGQAKKQTSFMEEVQERQIGDDNVFDDTEDEDDDDIDESAIDDDDDESGSDWEDDSPDENSGSSSMDHTLFQRVDSRPNLTSRPSMLTTLLNQQDRAAALGNIASKSTPSMYRSRNSSPAGPSLAVSPDSDDASPLMMRNATKRTAQVTRAAQPIAMPRSGPSTQSLALSPTTVRREMFRTELTPSLRTTLMSERKYKLDTRAAHCSYLQRRHTEHTNLKDIQEHPKPSRAHMDDLLNKNETKATWNEYFNQDSGGYHSKGW